MVPRMEEWESLKERLMEIETDLKEEGFKKKYKNRLRKIMENCLPDMSYSATKATNLLNDDTYNNNTEYKKELTETITKKTAIQKVTFGTCSHIGKDNAEYYVNFKSDDGKNVYSVIKRNKDITVSVN